MSWGKSDNPWSDENVYGPKSVLGKHIEDVWYGSHGIDRGTIGSQIGLQSKKNDSIWGSATSNSDEKKVICTQLRRDGLMSEADMRLCAEDAQERISEVTYRGYHRWAVPAVRMMRRSPRLTQFFRALAQARVDEIAARRGDRERANVLGKILIAVGEPACTLIGRCMKTATDYRQLYTQAEKPTR